jgi:ABC-type antimicrobial peptide transport system permease subunit
MLQDDVFSNWAHNSETEMKLMSFITAITIMLACLGLFGLVSYNITRRLKEFSVRKVFGASTQSNLQANEPRLHSGYLPLPL